MTTRAEIQVEQDGRLVVAQLAGEVDMTNAAYVREELTAAVPNGARGLVVELSGTTYLDSAAIELLFELSRRLARRRQVLRLVLPEDSPLRRLLTLTDVESVAELYASLADARASA
jgi:anti-sigma B factor antagonist